MKGCVRGYGNYEELTSSGVDPTELFDDVLYYEKLPDLVQPKQPDIALENTEKGIRSSDNLHILSMQRRLRSTYFETNHDFIFDLEFDRSSKQVSLYSTPSLFSLVTTYDRENKKVITSLICNIV